MMSSIIHQASNEGLDPLVACMEGIKGLSSAFASFWIPRDHIEESFEVPFCSISDRASCVCAFILIVHPKASIQQNCKA